MSPQSVTSARREVAAEVRGLMAKKRVTQERLASHLGVSQPSIARRLNGHVPFNVDELAAIAGYFDIPLPRLLEAATALPEAVPTEDSRTPPVR